MGQVGLGSLSRDGGEGRKQMMRYIVVTDSSF